MREETAIMEFLKKNRPGSITTVPLVVAEIEYGIARFSRASKKYLLLSARKEKLLKVVTLLPWIPEASVHFGSIKAALEKSGRLIDDFDIAIAAVAMSHSAAVLTANLAHFSRIEGLQALRWEEGEQDVVASARPPL